MGGPSKLSVLIGVIKDKASQSQAAVSSSSFYLALLRATTHDPFSPPNDKNLATLISLGNGPRSTASAAIDVLMNRLQNTRNSAVALKCLVAVHHIIKSGSFILQDQLSIFPSTGGRNYLKLSDFRDQSSQINWELSSWVRWYGKYVETLICTSRVLGFFLSSKSFTLTREKNEGIASSLINSELLREADHLVSLVEEICKRPESSHLSGNKLVTGITRSVDDDLFSAMTEVSIRIREFQDRLSCLSFSESVELVCGLKRLEDCSESLLLFSGNDQNFGNRFRRLVRETKEMVGVTPPNSTTNFSPLLFPHLGPPARAVMHHGKRGVTVGECNMTGEEGKTVMTTSRLGISKSVRLCDLTVRWADPIRFSSKRFGSSEISIRVMDPDQ